jgi:hemoglobin
MKRYALVLAPALAGALFGTSLTAILVKPADAQSAPAAEASEKPQMPKIAGEDTVDVYTPSNANAGATPFSGPGLMKAFHGSDGINRIVDDLDEHLQRDPRTAEIVHASDRVRFRRTLKEDFCYILGGGCDYTGRDMASAHRDHGIDTLEFNAVVELLQEAMTREGVPFAEQNKLLAKLAPMKRDIVVR